MRRQPKTDGVFSKILKFSKNPPKSSPPTPTLLFRLSTPPALLLNFLLFCSFPSAADFLYPIWPLQNRPIFAPLSVYFSHLCPSKPYIGISHLSHLIHPNILFSLILRPKFSPAKIHAPKGLPILRLKEVFESGVQFCTFFCTKTCHFFAFCSFFPLFVRFFVFFWLFLTFFSVLIHRCCCLQFGLFLFSPVLRTCEILYELNCGLRQQQLQVVKNRTICASM